MTKVVNIKNDPYDIYIGRGSPFGNPYSDNPNSQAKWIVESRDESIRLYEQWVWNQPSLIKQIRKDLKDKILGCYCKPLNCHGDILMKIAESPSIEWAKLIKEEQEKPYYKILLDKMQNDTATIYPEKKNVFNAFKLTPFEEVKVVILGQDPYINPGQAHGLSFSVESGALPPSLKNIFKELKSDLNISNTSGDLTPWAKQGVLLLNSTLTVRAGESNSHQDYGWQTFTDRMISALNNKVSPVVFLLWGGFARKKAKLITNKLHLVLSSGHPSPLSCKTYFGNHHFSKCNLFLIKNGLEEINWKT